MWPPEAAAVLTGLARAAIARQLRLDHPTSPTADWLDQPGASFVTLTIDQALRGCIGSLAPWRPLGQDVAANARAAAFDDPRFRPLNRDEFDEVAIEVSVLSASQPITFSSRQDLLGQLHPGVDGLILTARGHRGTFLPQVWAELPEPSQFLTHLLRKAGLPADYWADDIAVERYAVTAFHESA